MDKKNNEIKRANRKAMPKFILLSLLGLLFGYIIGYWGVKSELYTASDSMKDLGAFFGAYVSSWLLLAEAVIMPAVCIPIYRSAKKMLAAWDGEDEEIPNAIDRKTSIVIWISSAALLLSYLLLAATYSGTFADYPNELIKIFASDARFISFCVGLLAFLAVTFEAIRIQQKCVDIIKRMNPEKTVSSYYDTKFQKKWLDSYDEAEKIKIGKCAFKAYSITNSLCATLSAVLAIYALFFDIGFLPSVMVCLIGIVNLSVYQKELIRYSKAGNKIS